jgi:hypothetical protein
LELAVDSSHHPATLELRRSRRLRVPDNTDGLNNEAVVLPPEVLKGLMRCWLLVATMSLIIVPPKFPWLIP